MIPLRAMHTLHQEDRHTRYEEETGGLPCCHHVDLVIHTAFPVEAACYEPVEIQACIATSCSRFRYPFEVCVANLCDLESVTTMEPGKKLGR